MFNTGDRTTADLAEVEVLIRVRETAELSRAPIKVDVGGAERRQEAHLRLPRLSCGGTPQQTTGEPRQMS